MPESNVWLSGIASECTKCVKVLQDSKIVEQTSEALGPCHDHAICQQKWRGQMPDRKRERHSASSQELRDAALPPTPHTPAILHRSSAEGHLTNLYLKKVGEPGLI